MPWIGCCPTGAWGSAYGGDFGEAVHDGTFVCDGLVSATSEPSAGLVAWANAVAPVVAEPNASGAITVTSRLRHATASGLVVAWSSGVSGDLHGEVALRTWRLERPVVVHPETEASRRHDRVGARPGRSRGSRRGARGQWPRTVRTCRRVSASPTSWVAAS